jgi:prepilin-type N-terminal cleavage/methylation domain-containing protein
MRLVKTHHNAGFTLLELIIALSIAAILTAIALPNWTRLLPAHRLSSSARQVQSELHHIKMRAVAEHTAYELTYRAGASEYTIERDTTTLARKPLPEGIVISRSGTVSFSPRGTAGSNRVRLQNQAGLCEQVVVSATGRVRICHAQNCGLDC